MPEQTPVSGTQTAPAVPMPNNGAGQVMPAQANLVVAEPVHQPVASVPATSTVPTGIPAGAPSPQPVPESEKKGFLQSLKDQWESHVAVNKAKSEKQQAGEQAGKVINEAVTSGEKLSTQERNEILQAEKIFQEGLASIRDLIAPSSMDVEFDKIKLSGMYAKSMFVFTYPRYLDTNWMSPLVNFDATMDV
ncbi:MAG: hypothetical protein AAB606_03830, partial [Patescibacteria group bacterium]